jgi:DNA-binding NarL/FixJ family response regulator
MRQPRPTVRVLLVEDSPEMRTRVVALLSEIENVEVAWSAENVAEALEALAHLHVHAAVVDLRLPDGSGLDVVAAIRASLRDVVTVVMTAFESPELERKCLHAGADYFLSKSLLAGALPEIFASIGAMAEPD